MMFAPNVEGKIIKVLFLLLPFACDGQIETNSPICFKDEFSVSNAVIATSHTCIQADNIATIEFEYSPTNTMSWFYYLVTIFVKTDVPRNVVLDATEFLRPEIRMRTVDALDNFALLGYYQTKFSGFGTIGYGENPEIKFCILAEIGTAGSTKPSQIHMSFEAICEE